MNCLSYEKVNKIVVFSIETRGCYYASSNMDVGFTLEKLIILQKYRQHFTYYKYFIKYTPLYFSS